MTDYSTFWERETGKVDLDALHPSWLIFSDGFVGGWLQAMLKRIFDVVASLMLLVAALPVLVMTGILVRLESPGPVFYRQERVGLNGQTFMLLKFRSASIEDSKEKFQFDLYYIKNYSLFLDLIVLIQTFRIVLWPNGVR